MPNINRRARALDEVTKDGFRASDLGADRIQPDLAFSSARLALRAYCATSSAIHGSMHLVEPGSSADDQQTKDFNLGTRYKDAAFETIIHFQHFAELVIKDALRADHELLVCLAGEEHVLLHKLLHGEALPTADEAKLHAIEASSALRRVCALRAAGRLDPTYDFIVAHRTFLEALNGLRNRLWHRGTFTLRFAALDELVGKHALPFLRAVAAHPAYLARAGLVRHQALACGLDPFEEIFLELQRDPWSVSKVAFLKELARAAYENPLVEATFFEDDNERLRKRAEAVATQFPDHCAEEVRTCPVCGMSAFVVYSSSDFVEDDQGNEGSIDWTWLAKCEGCTLELRETYGNPSEHGFASIPDLWRQL